MTKDEPILDGIAIIGMVGRFPGASSVAEFWQNQCNGVESISHFSSEQLRATHGSDASKFVAARSILKDVDQFDAAFFGINPKDAEVLDPQHRVFLECCWEAIEDAGYDPKACPELTGVYAGCSPSTYFLRHVCSDRQFLDDFTAGYQVSHYPALLGSNVDFLATRVSYKLNLRGPSFTLQAGCSTSLLAVCQASQALQTFECDMALAGGVSITFPQERGYPYQDGGMVSPDGHLRAFDSKAQGTVFGSGVGVVVLKRMENAMDDGDRILAVIRGFAVNNDGSGKVGYTAPSIEGQARVIAMAQEAAGVDPESIGYVEAHGTGTPLGDPIEILALTKAFRRRLGTQTAPKQFCAVGTAKANVGHLDIAAGVTGLIHAVNVVREGLLPPMLHFQRPNPQLKLEESPFFVNTKLSRWPVGDLPRRAGISAFGIGGTNAHVVIEQARPKPANPTLRASQLLTLSARSEAALEKAAANLAEHLSAHRETNIADAAWTLQTGRHAFEYRRSVAVTKVEDAIARLGSKTNTRRARGNDPEVAFLFPGQGSQHPNMAREIYDGEPVFKKEIDLCSQILRPHLELDLRTLLYSAEQSSEAQARVTETFLAQPAIFAVSYALAQLWISWGIPPAAMLGHSIGEYVSACIAGVFSLEDALKLVAIRGRMMQSLPQGAMLSIALGETELRGRIKDGCAIAAVNGLSLCVVSGPTDRVGRLEEQLTAEGVACRPLVTSHAFHSPMMDPILKPFMECVARVPLQEPRIPYISCVTGNWIKASEATNPAYWSKHLRQSVQFADGVNELTKNQNRILLEVGPGNALSSLAKRNAGFAGEQIIVSSLAGGYTGAGDAVQLMEALGTLWTVGVQPDWKTVHSGERRQRIALPTYPFERKRYWVDRPTLVGTQEPLESQSPSISHNSRIDVQTQVQPTQQDSRMDCILSELAGIIEELSGIEVAQFDSATSFIEMGFDSLFLTQVAQALQKKYAVKITFRQLLGDLATLEAVAAYLLARITPDSIESSSVSPPDAIDVPSIARGVSQPTAPQEIWRRENSMPESAAEKLMREQMQAMNQLFATQLEALRQTPAAALSPSAAPQEPRGAHPVPAPAVPKLPGSSVETPATSKLGGAQVSFGHTLAKHIGSSGELTERQRLGLKFLVSDHNTRTSKSKSLTEQYRRFLADPRVVSGFRQQWKEIVYPIITVRSKGSRLWDVDGNEYIDLLNGFGPILLGHRPDFIENAIEKQLHEGFEIGPQTPLAGEVASMFCSMTGNERMTFCNTGSEAVIAALRVARTVTGRSKVVAFSGSYHGMFDEVLAKGFRSKGGEPQVMPAAPGIPREKVANYVILDYGTPESLEWIRQHASELAAVLVEPVQSRHPQLQPINFLKEVRNITTQSGSALIFDEVVTGFRVHPGGCQALFGIRADLATYGKVLAGGMPIGVLAGKAQFMDALDGGAWRFGDDSCPETGVTFFAGTFVRHPLALAAAKAVLLHFEEQGPQLQERLTATTGQLVVKLNDIFARSGLATRIETFGSWFYFTFPSEERFGSLLYYFMRAKGIHLLEGFPCFLTTTHSDADLECIVAAFRDSVEEMIRWEFFAPANGDIATVATQPSTKALSVKSVSEAPTTEPQFEVWLSDQLGAEASCSYIESFSLHLRGNVTERALKEALRQAVDRHDALWATFGAGGSVQRFVSGILLDIPTVDLTNLTAGERERELKKIVSDDACKPFSLTKGPLVRAQLLKLEPQHWALIFTAHHIVCDGWSSNVLLDEVSKIYNAIQSGKPHNLEAPPSFAAYATAQKDFVESAEGKRVEQYWLNQFERPAPRMDLPIDRPRPAVRNYAGATYRCKLGAALYQNIRKLGARQKCTPFVTLLTGFQILLSRLSGQDDVVIGVPTAGQSVLDDGSLVGHCVNFLPLRVSTNRDSTTAQSLAQTMQTVLEAYEHQNYTYGRLVRKLSMQRDPSRLPLTEVQFNLERVGDGLQFDGIQAEVDPNPKCFVNFDIFLNIVESKDGLVLDCDYNTGLFDQETIARWLGHYETLLEGMADQENRSAFEIPLASKVDLLRWNELNSTRANYPQVCVHQLFEAQVKQRPDSIAVVFADEELTYAELDQRANRIANYIGGLGVTKGDLVGILVERSIDMLAALLGVMKSGAAYVPMDPTYPAERISFVLSDANVPVLLTQQGLVQNLSSPGTKVVCLDAIREELTTQPQHLVAGNATPDDLAYVIYTSGSTGRPKGVAIAHRSVVNLLHSMSKKPGLAASDVLTAVTTLSFDIAGLELFLPLYVGAKLVIASREVAADGAQLLAQLRNSGTTVMQATPITWKLLLEAGWDGNPSLKVLCGGEVLPRGLANSLVKFAGSVWNMYGPTETTIWSGTNQVHEGEGPVPIGPPIDNTSFYILDTKGQITPVGVLGELHIAGDGLACGYYRRPELTAEKFITCPPESGLPSPLYKTGDLVRWHPNRDIEFLGRLDNQVKLRGYRIELGEIETVISRYPGVKEAIVVVREDLPGEKRLVAYLTSDLQAISVSVVREFLTGKLPNYMHPSVVIRMDALPLTPNGKIDRSATSLPVPDMSKAAREREFTPPGTDTEKSLAGIWAEVLHLDRVGINDNLFELGADSLHIFQIAARAAEAGITIAPAQFLRYRTIASLLAQMETATARAASGKKAAIPSILPVAREKYRVRRSS